MYLRILAMTYRSKKKNILYHYFILPPNEGRSAFGLTDEMLVLPAFLCVLGDGGGGGGWRSGD